mgnify:FL=1|jgi:hypothetical protein|tara:strand:+ start:1874 stop:2032 length:159 start_codon:yes stop_codon:yes gene_type:complete
MGILDRKSTEHTHEDGTTHSHEGGDVEHTHGTCTCKSNKGRDIHCAVTEHSG